MTKKISGNTAAEEARTSLWAKHAPSLVTQQTQKNAVTVTLAYLSLHYKLFEFVAANTNSGNRLRDLDFFNLGKNKMIAKIDELKEF